MQSNKSFSTDGCKYALAKTCHTSVTFREATSGLALGRKSREKGVNKLGVRLLTLSRDL